MGDETTTDRIVARVAESAAALRDLLDTPQNFPFENYIDPTDAKGLVAALSVPSSEWTRDDLELILIVRDEYYEVRSTLGDRSEDAEHSLDQLISAFDRLYVDLQRGLNALDQIKLAEATAAVAQMRHSPIARASSAASLAEELRRASGEVVVRSHETTRHMQTTINFNFSPTLIVNSKVVVEVMRNVRINISRLSASAFSVRMSLVEGPVFQGIFRFLHDSADKALAGIRDMLRSLNSAYQDVKEIVSDVEALADKGNRFVKLVSHFMKAVFGEDALPEPDVVFGQMARNRGTTFSAALPVGGGNVLLAGRGGSLATLDLSSGRVANPRTFESGLHVHALALMRDGDAAFGTEDGLAVGSALTSSRAIRASFIERVVAVTTMPWGKRQAIVTGSSKGDVRRFQMAGNVSQWSDDRDGGVGHTKIGRTVTFLVPWGDTLVAASEDAVFFLDERLEPVRKDVDVGFKIRDACPFDAEHIVIAGEGNVAMLAFEGSTTNRLLTMSKSSNYVCVRKLNDRLVLVGDDKGDVVAVNVWSGAEVGRVSTGITLRGMQVVGDTVVAHGGGWQSRDATNVATFKWSQISGK